MLSILSFLCFQLSISAYGLVTSTTSDPGSVLAPFDPYEFYGVKDPNPDPSTGGSANTTGGENLTGGPGSINHAIDPYAESLAVSQWQKDCAASCLRARYTQVFCTTTCKLQEQSVQSLHEPYDAPLATACDEMNADRNPELAFGPDETASLATRLRSQIYTSGNNCIAEITVRDVYDWQPPLKRATSSCKAGSKPNGINFVDTTCVFYSPSRKTIRWTDGPSLPDTLATINRRFSAPRPVLEAFGQVVHAPKTFHKILSFSNIEIANALHALKTAFWYAGINHDFCYHSGLQTYGFTKAICDDNLLADLLISCKAHRVRAELNIPCTEWAEFMHWGVRLNMDAKLFVISITKDAWNFSNYGSPYHIINIVRAIEYDQTKRASVPKYRLTEIELEFTMLDDGKAAATTGVVEVAFPGSPALQLAIPAEIWPSGSVHTLRSVATKTFTAEQFQEIMTVGLKYKTKGKDRMRFNMQVALTFDGVGRVTHCLKAQSVGDCGLGCFIWCPTNTCSYTSRAFHIGFDPSTGC